MDGASPRYYISAPAGGWLNTEATVYCRVDSYTSPASSAIAIITRTNHHLYTSDPCAARGYYARVYFDSGRIQVKKEFRHDSDNRVIYSDGVNAPIGISVKFNMTKKYLGIKSIVRTNPDQRSVNLRIYCDFSEGKHGGEWQLMLEYNDARLKSRYPTDCVYGDAIDQSGGDSAPVLRPGQVTIIRSDAVHGVHLRHASVREIQPL
uniref:Uncharacterized protein n=2 Tax=Spongospora subterranea TaxID=70186 RepID=A0A0H5QUH7_9EUKA|eukprot:CRZ05226.1 hypothetical protein [Spongospora subterranea]